MLAAFFTWLDDLPLSLALVGGLAIGLAPFFPEPHIVEKLRMLREGRLRRPLDIFDLLLHATPLALLALKLLRMGLGAG